MPLGEAGPDQRLAGIRDEANGESHRHPALGRFRPPHGAERSGLSARTDRRSARTGAVSARPRNRTEPAVPEFPFDQQFSRHRAGRLDHRHHGRRHDAGHPHPRHRSLRRGHVRPRGERDRVVRAGELQRRSDLDRHQPADAARHRGRAAGRRGNRIRQRFHHREIARRTVHRHARDHDVRARPDLPLYWRLPDHLSSDAGGLRMGRTGLCPRAADADDLLRTGDRGRSSGSRDAPRSAARSTPSAATRRPRGSPASTSGG